MKVEFVTANYGHLFYIANNLQKEQVLETLAVAKSPHDAIVYSVKKSTLVTVALFDKEPVCVFGVFSECLIGENATVWMMATERLRNHPVTLMRHARRFINGYGKMFPALEVFCYDNFDKSMTWLKKLGFSRVGHVKNFAHLRMSE